MNGWLHAGLRLSSFQSFFTHVRRVAPAAAQKQRRAVARMLIKRTLNNQPPRSCPEFLRRPQFRGETSSASYCAEALSPAFVNLAEVTSQLIITPRGSARRYRAYYARAADPALGFAASVTGVLSTRLVCRPAGARRPPTLLRGTFWSSAPGFSLLDWPGLGSHSPFQEGNAGGMLPVFDSLKLSCLSSSAKTTTRNRIGFYVERFFSQSPGSPPPPHRSSLSRTPVLVRPGSEGAWLGGAPVGSVDSCPSIFISLLHRDLDKEREFYFILLIQRSRRGRPRAEMLLFCLKLGTFFGSRKLLSNSALTAI